MGEQTKNMLVGFFILAACALTVSLILFLKPSVGDGKKTYVVRFSNINKIGVGTQVMFAGKPVGEVVAVDEIYDARKQPNDTIGRLYFYQLVIKVDSSINIYSTDDVSIQTSGLLGEKSIAITPKVPPKGVTPRLITNQPIYAESLDPIENAFNQLSRLSDEMKVSFKFLNEWLDKNSEHLTQAVTSFRDAMHEISIAIGDFNREEILKDVKGGIDSFTSVMNQVHGFIDEMQKENTFSNIAETVKNIKIASQNVNIITDDIASGRGTVGKLIKNDDMYLRVTAILSKMDTLMNDVNHYGVLFHLNKSWQRERLQRVTLIHSLDSPVTFKNYFEKEIDDVNMAMSRLSMVIQKAESNPKKESILKDGAFREDFAQLLRDVDQLSSNLKLYNEQLNYPQAV
ncbi:MAG: MCE family protein, partial [Chlamydiae bacterium]|nr:MCE family protein [Chlamydiota bacterium]